MNVAVLCRRLSGLFSVVCILILAGCWPTERVVWSPKGDRALVLGDDGLHTCARDGQLSPVLTGRVDCACWLPDGQHVLVVMASQATNWPSYVAGISTNRVAAIGRMGADALTGLRSKNAPVGFDGVVPTNWSWQTRCAVMFFLQDHYATEMSKLVPKLEETKYANPRVWDIVLGTVTSNALQVERVVARSESTVFAIAAAPQGNAYAFTAGEWEPRGEMVTGPVSLFVGSTNAGGEVQEVSSDTSVFFDWSSDGRRVVFVAKDKGLSGGGFDLGWMAQHGPLFMESTNEYQVTSVSKTVVGNLIQDLALVPFRYDTRVKCLSTNTIIFAVPPLPAAGVGGRSSLLEPRTCLFVFDRERKLRQLDMQVAGEQVGELRSFSVSPGGEYFGWHGDKGLVYVMTLKSGQVRCVQSVPEEGVRGYCPRTVPSWLPTGEFCFSVPTNAPAGSTNRSEIVIWSPRDGSTQCVSRKWSQECCGEWLAPRTN